MNGKYVLDPSEEELTYYKEIEEGSKKRATLVCAGHKNHLCEARRGARTQTT